MPTEIQGKWFRINYLTSLIRRFHIYRENNSTISQVQKIKNLPAESRRPRFDPLGREDPKGIAAHRSGPVWRIPGTEEADAIVHGVESKERHN